MSGELERTHLFEWHDSHGDVVPFVGWKMPVRYTDIREEHMAVRNTVGIFDTTHMYRFLIKGPQAVDFLQRISTNNVRKLKVNGGHYTTCLNEQGGIHDDLMLYRIGEEEYIWVSNAVNGPKIWGHMKKHAKEFDVSVKDSSKEIVMIAVQGPKAFDLLSKMTDKDVHSYSRFSCHPVELAGYPCYLCRSGYTGEDGAEILLLDAPFNEQGRSKAIDFWTKILEQGKEFDAKPCGLGARDSTRLEAGLVLYGHELDEETSPIEARISYAVKFKVEPHYIGYDIVWNHKKEDGIRKTRIGLAMIDRGIPRQDYTVFSTGKEIGRTTSGTLSPILDTGIGLAYVKPETVDEGDIIEVSIKGRLRRAEVTSWPFFNTDEYGFKRKM